MARAIGHAGSKDSPDQPTLLATFSGRFGAARLFNGDICFLSRPGGMSRTTLRFEDGWGDMFRVEEIDVDIRVAPEG